MLRERGRRGWGGAGRRGAGAGKAGEDGLDGEEILVPARMIHRVVEG